MSEELTDTLQTESQRSPLPGNPPPRKPSAAPFASNARRRLILCLLLATCTLALYNRANRNSFVNYDDDVYVTGNHAIQSGLNSSTIRWAFTTFDGANWHPLTWV